MAKQRLIRKYSMSDADLALTVSNFLVFINRDSVELAVRGVTAIDITDFQALGNAFEVLPSDAVYQAQVTAEVQAKDVAFNLTLTDVRLISGFFEQEWGLESWQYKTLNVKGVANTSEAKLLMIARGVINQANDNLLALAGVGLVQADIDKLTTDSQTFENNINAVIDKEGIRDGKTQERIEKGNELYTSLQKFARIGKLVWEDVDKVKYEDYVINPTVHSGLGKVLNLAGVYIPASVDAPAEVALSWTAVTGATEYIVFRSIVPIDLPSATFVDIATVSITQHMDLDLINVPGNFYYKVRAINLTEAGADSNEAKVQIV